MKEKYDPSIHNVLDNQDWENVIPIVLKYAVARANKYYWLGYKVDPEELVHEAIARAYGIGKNDNFRNWNREEYPQIEDFLISIISSMTSQEASHIKEFPEISLTKEDGTNNEVIAAIDMMGGTDAFDPKNPEEITIEKERIAEISEKLEEAAKDNDEMGYVVICLEDGMKSRKEIAKETGINVDKIYQIARTLKGRLDKLPNPILKKKG